MAVVFREKPTANELNATIFKILSQFERRDQHQADSGSLGF